MISLGRLWWLLKRDIKRGWDASIHEYRTKPRITEWNWPYWSDAPMAVPVHRNAVSRMGSRPACRATFETLAPSPKKADAAIDSTVPRPWR